MPDPARRAAVWEQDGRWFGRLDGLERTLKASTRERVIGALRRAAGPRTALTIEITPPLAGVAEAAAILGWDKRRIITYVDRGSFPEPIAELAGGRVWRREDVERFSEDWRASHDGSTR